MTSFILHVLIFAVPCWITNMSFQFIRAVKNAVPKDHHLRKIKIDSFDFTFLDGKPFIGSGLRLTSFVPILLLPFFFNYWLPISIVYYVSLTALVFLGDLLGSIIKRRLGYRKGQFAPLIDHGDYILVTGAVFIFSGHISIMIFAYALGITYLLHPLACLIGYKLKIKNEPF